MSAEQRAAQWLADLLVCGAHVTAVHDDSQGGWVVVVGLPDSLYQHAAPLAEAMRRLRDDAALGAHSTENSTIGPENGAETGGSAR